MAKVKITHKVSGVVTSVTPAEAKALKENPRFAKIYTFEETVKAPDEIGGSKEETVKQVKTVKAIEPQQPPKNPSFPREVG